VSKEDQWTLDLASRLEALLEIGGTAVAAGGLFLAVQGLPHMHASLMGLPPGFGGRDTGAFLCAALVGLVVMPALLRRLMGGWPARQLLGRRRISAGKAVGAGLLVAAALTLWSQFLLWLAPEILLPVWRSLGITRAPQVWAAFFFAAPVASALPEEIFFRGYGQGILATRCGRGWGLLLVAGGFSLAHAGQGWSSVFLAIVPAAVALGLLYDATGSILAPWVAHTATNAAAFLAMGGDIVYPGAGSWILMALTAISAAILWRGRRQVMSGLGHLQGLGRSLGEDGRDFFLLVTAGLMAMATVIFIYGLLAPLLPGDAARVPVTGLMLWGLSLLIHHRRGAAWGANGP
jgi:membrane protease YdiL (CAAX protease family)